MSSNNLQQNYQLTICKTYYISSFVPSSSFEIRGVYSTYKINHTKLGADGPGDTDSSLAQ